MKNELGPKGNGADANKTVFQGESRSPVTFDEYFARLTPEVRASIPRDVMTRMKNRWRTHDKVGGLEQVGPIKEGQQDESVKPGPKESFEEYQQTKLARVTSRVGGIPHQVTQLVKEHWRSGQWNEQSGTNPESD